MMKGQHIFFQGAKENVIYSVESRKVPRKEAKKCHEWKEDHDGRARTQTVVMAVNVNGLSQSLRRRFV